MKKKNSFQIIKTSTVLTEKEQNDCRVVLKDALKQRGIISLCLDNQYLFVEYNPEFLNTEKIFLMLEDIGFPADKDIKNVA
jgi:hypothetical protein